VPTPRLVQIQAWSYSRFQTYEQCPQKSKYQVIDKLKEPDGAAGMKGTRVHALAAVWVSRQLPPLDKDNTAFYPELEALVKAKKIPVELETFEVEFGLLRRNKTAQVEQQWTFNRDWEDMGEQGWFSSQAWLRIKVDEHHLEVKKNGALRRTTVHIVDYKTGREYEDHALQRSLYALGAFLKYPDAERVTAAHWYLDAGVERKQEWARAVLPALQAEWVKRTTAMLNDTTYAPRPSDKCRYCWFRKANNGPCKF